MITDLLKDLVNSIRFIAFSLGFGLNLYENIRASSKIKAVQNKFDPDHLFVRKNEYSSMGLSSNLYWVDRTHGKCTPEFLTEWDKVYGAHWRRIMLLLVLWVALGFAGKHLRKFLLDVIPF